MQRNVSVQEKKKGKQTYTYLVGIDVGFGGLKYISNAKPQLNVIPSGVVKGTPSTRPLFPSDEIDISKLVVKTEDGTFFVGEHALNMPTGEDGSVRTEDRNRASDVKSRVLFQTGIGLALPDEDGEYDVFIVTGLPNADFSKKIRPELEEFLNRSFTVEFYLDSERSITKTVNVKRVEILRQPEGALTYNQFKFDPENFVVPTENHANYIGVVDFGHVTTDYALFQGGVILEDKTKNKSTIGVTEVYKLLRVEIELKFDELGYQFYPTDADLDYAIRTGKVKYMNTEFDVSEEIEAVVKDRAESIARSILAAWGNEINRLDLILATGGGANVYAEKVVQFLKERNIQEFLIQEDSQFDNVLGFYMYGIMELADEYSKDILFEQYITPVKELNSIEQE